MDLLNLDRANTYIFLDQRNEIEKPTSEHPRGKGTRSMTFQPMALPETEIR